MTGTQIMLEDYCYELNCDPPKNSFVEGLNPNVMVFGELTGFRWGHEGGVLMMKFVPL